MSTESHQMPSSVTVALRSCCPACGAGPLYDGFLTVKPACGHCGADLSFADSGDGPAVFIMMIAGFIIVGLVLWVEFTWSPPYWLHALLWLPMTIALPMLLLRPFKSWMIAQQFRHKAREGRLDI